MKRNPLYKQYLKEFEALDLGCSLSIETKNDFLMCPWNFEVLKRDLYLFKYNFLLIKQTD